MLLCDPEKVRTRAADLIKTGREFLEASWSVAAVGADAPIDVEQLGGSGFAELDDVRAAAARSGHPWWTLSQLSDESAVELDIRAAPSARGHQHDIDEHLRDAARARLDRRVRRASSRPGPEPRIASWSGWPNPTPRPRCWSRERRPNRGVVGVLKGPLHDGVVIPGRRPGRHHRRPT